MTIPAQLVLDARDPEAIFGELEGDRDAQLRTARTIYRALSRELHPDVGGDGEAFRRLNDLWNAARTMIERGTYGSGLATLVEPVLVRTRRRAYRITHQVARGDSCNIYSATYQGAVPTNVSDAAVVKIARSSRDNDLVTNEAVMLKRLLSSVSTYDQLAPYLPSYLEAFGVRAAGGTRRARPRQAIAFGDPYGRLFSLREVRRAYPGGVHPKDAAWMFRRVLSALGLVHANGIVHAAVTPDHVLIHPAMHGVVLVDWKYAVEEGGRPRAMSSAWAALYAPEIPAREGATAETDIYMAARTMCYVMGVEDGDPRGLLNASMRGFMRGCMGPRRRRPSDAFALQTEYDQLIERLWGPRRFRAFRMP